MNDIDMELLEQGLIIGTLIGEMEERRELSFTTSYSTDSELVTLGQQLINEFDYKKTQGEKVFFSIFVRDRLLELEKERCITCRHCGKVLIESENHSLDSYSEDICDDCFEEFYGYCDVCGEEMEYYDEMSDNMDKVNKILGTVGGCICCKECAKKYLDTKESKNE